MFIFMSSNDDTVDIEKPYGVYSQNFVVDDFIRLILHQSILLIKN